MGVLISPVRGSLVTNHQEHVALKLLADGDYKAFDIAAREILVSRGIVSDTKNLSHSEALLLAASSIEESKKWVYVDDLRKCGDEFPHWRGPQMWDDLGEVVDEWLFYIPEPDFENTDSSKSFSVSMSHPEYSLFRELVSLTFLNATPRDVWKDPEKYSHDNIWLLVDGSDNEGIISNHVVQKISSVLNDPLSLDKFSDAVGIHPVGSRGGDSFMDWNNRYENFALLFAVAAVMGWEIRFG